MVPNPIYEGPTYETINVATRTMPTTPTVTPTTVRESPYFGHTIDPTYENGTHREPPDVNISPAVCGSYENNYTRMKSASSPKKSSEEV